MHWGSICYTDDRMSEGIDIEQVRAAKQKAFSLFAGLARVNGIGITRLGDRYGIKVNLAEPPSDGVEFPKEVDGVPVVVEIVGPIAKQ
jgi:hypothetical protein